MFKFMPVNGTATFSLALKCERRQQVAAYSLENLLQIKKAGRRPAQRDTAVSAFEVICYFVSRLAECLGWIFACAQMRTTATSCRVLAREPTPNKKRQVADLLNEIQPFPPLRLSVVLRFVWRSASAGFSLRSNANDKKASPFCVRISRTYSK